MDAANLMIKCYLKEMRKLLGDAEKVAWSLKGERKTLLTKCHKLENVVLTDAKEKREHDFQIKETQLNIE